MQEPRNPAPGLQDTTLQMHAVLSKFAGIIAIDWFRVSLHGDPYKLKSQFGKREV